jgi:hypothetical protein
LFCQVVPPQISMHTSFLSITSDHLGEWKFAAIHAEKDYSKGYHICLEATSSY